jgi:signal transduction histidine kinase
MVTAGAFLHSLMKAGDPFLRKQIRLSLMAPVLVSLFFICLYLLPGVLRLPPVDFRYFALFFLLLPFALPLAMDNLALYHERLAVEQASQQEKEHIRADLHDLILNNLAVISRTSEVAQTQLGGGNVSVSKRLETIQDLTAKTSRRLREFLWVLDDRHSSWDAVSSHLRSWGHEITEDTGCEFELEVAQEVSSLSPPDLRLRITLDRIYKEAILNAVTHARAGQIKASLFCHGATVICAVQDNGIGFVLDTALDGHYGIRNMQRRAEELGGTVTITSQCGQGTSVKIELPLQ